MPITGPASYIPTTQAFLAHWDEANAALGAGHALTIRKQTINAPADVTRAVLDAHYEALLTRHQEVQAAVVADDLARGAYFDGKTVLFAKLNMFNEKVRALLANSRYERALPEVPGIDNALGIITDALNKALSLWVNINENEVLGTGVALVLRDGTAVEDFEPLVNGLTPLFRAVSTAELGLKMTRERRNDLQDVIYPILKQYRVVVAGSFAADSAIMESLPMLTPAQGHTPAAVNADIVWDAAAVKAKITWAASDDAELDHYEVRYSPGTTYHDDEEDVLASFTPEEAREYLTDHALLTSGATALFKVYVILTTGNEKGGSALEITRP